MKNNRHTKKQLHKIKFRAALCLIMMLLLTNGLLGVLHAKYYAGHSNKGVATASGLYFTSNVLKNVSNKTQDEYPVIYNTTAWDGASPCELPVQIRNYQNQLFYNDMNLDVMYNITFRLVGESDQGIYSVTYNNGNDTLTENITTDGITISNMKLQGGKAIYNQFTVKVTRPASQSDNPNYCSVGICVIATPVSPGYIASSYTLGGVLHATMVSAQYSLTHNFDKITAPIDEYSGFPYTITYMPGEDDVEHDIIVIWDNTLEIDEFNEYYNQAKLAGKAGTAEDGKHYMYITIQPYSSIQIAFYRGGTFLASSKEELEALVTVEDETATGGAKGSELHE